MKKNLLILAVLLIGLLSCQSQKPIEHGAFTAASYNLRYVNEGDNYCRNVIGL